MSFLLGIAVALVSLYASIVHLQQDSKSYYDFVALAMVIGGTLAVSIITFPWAYRSEFGYRFRQLLFSWQGSRSQLLRYCLGLIQSVNQGQSPSVKGNSLDRRLMREGLELIGLGFSSEKIEGILNERLNYSIHKSRKISQSIRGLAKYPPAFGLAGTVLGLVHLMHGVSQGVDPAETGVRMAIALVATFYGLLVANLIVNPAGENIEKHTKEDEDRGVIAMQTILLAAERVNLLEAQEVLNSFVEERERVDVIGITTTKGEAA
jgi:chemotaxis protein MotA